MLKITRLIAVPFVLLAAMQLQAAENVVEDQGVGLTYKELEYQVGQWSGQMRDVAANDMGDRLELLNKSLLNKKLAAEADTLVKGLEGEAYWQYMAGLEAYKRDYVLRQFSATIVVPDMSMLARELYETEKEKYALVKERRMTSHILFGDIAGTPRSQRMSEAHEVLALLRAGEDFEAMVAKYSTEPGAVEKKGKFNRWMKLGEAGVSPPYSGGAFEIEKIGEYSEPVGTQFGAHIIRLDGIQEAHYKTFEEVKGNIVAHLETEYKKLAMKDYLAKFHFSDEAYIDGDAMDKLFAPYLRK